MGTQVWLAELLLSMKVKYDNIRTYQDIKPNIGTDDLGLGGEDDSLTTGHAGARAGCCIINLIEG